MNSESDPQRNAEAGREDVNDMQRAIRERAYHSINRKPIGFWYSSPRRLAGAAVLAALVVGLMTFGADRFLRVFHNIVELYVIQPARTPRTPALPAGDQQPGVMYVTPESQPSSSESTDDESGPAHP